MFATFKRLSKHLFRSWGQHAPSRKPKPRFARLRIETLEDRLAPAQFDFYGISSDWNDPDNWANGQIPGATDDVSISDATNFVVANLNIQSSESISVRQMWITRPNFSLTVNGHLSVEHLTLNNSTLTGSGEIDIFTSLTSFAGTMNGTGITRSHTSADFYVMPVFAESRTFANIGSANIYNGFSLASTASIVNQGTLTLWETEMTYGPTTPIVNNGTLIFDGGIITFTGTNTIANAVEFRAGRFFVEGTLTIPTLTHHNGFIDGAGSLVVTNSLTWLPGGVQVGAGSTTIAATGKLVLPQSTSTARMLAGRTLTVHGTREFPPTMQNGEPVYISVGFVTENPNHVNEQAFSNGSVNRPPANTPVAVPPFDPTAAAGALYRAMFGGIAGLGTDEDGVFAQLEKMIVASSVQTLNNQAALFTAYTRLYPGRSLLADLASELSGNDLVRANVLIIACNWNMYVVHTLRAAMFGSSVSVVSTDTDRMARLLFDSRTNTATVESQYNSQYATTATGGTVTPADIRADIGAKLFPAQKDRIIAALDGDRARADAANLMGLLRNLNGPAIPTSEALLTLLQNRTPAEIMAIRTAYGTLTLGNSTTLLTDVAAFLGNDPDYSGLSAERIDYANALLNGNRIQIAVRGIHLAMAGAGTDEARIWGLLENTYVDERAMIAQNYFKAYDKTLTQAFCEEFSDSTIWGNELDRTLRIYRNGGLTLAERIYFAVQGWGTDDPMLQAALAEIRTMTPAQIAALDQEFPALANGQSLRDGILGDLGGRDAMRADIELRGATTDIAVEAQRLLEERGWEGDINSNYNMWSDLINDHYANMDRGTTELAAALSAYQANPCLLTEQPLREAIDRLRVHTDSFIEGRTATIEIAANAFATAAGIAVVIGTGGVASPLIVALAAGAGGATQALTRMALSGHFDWEELPADFVNGAIAGSTTALGFSAFTRTQITNGAKVGILRQVAGSTFIGGAASGGAATALNDGTWRDGMAVGLMNVGLATAISGFASSVIPTTFGAGIYTARAALPFARRVVTVTGTTVTNLFDGTWVRAGVAAMTNPQVFGTFLENTLASWGTQVEAIALRLISAAPTESELATRQALRNILNTTSWTQIQRDCIEDVAINTLRTNRAQLSTLGSTGTRTLMEDGTRSMFNSIKEASDALQVRVNNSGIVSGGITDAQLDALAHRLTTLPTIDDAAIRAALQAPDVFGPIPNLSADLVQALGAWCRSSRDSNAAATLSTLTLRTNTRLGTSTESAIMGSGLSVRKSLNQATAGRYLYVIDESGAMWLGAIDAVQSHSALVPATAQVRAAGEIRICLNGDVHLNVRSGHFMSGQTLRGSERQIFVDGMTNAIRDAGYTPASVYSDITDVFSMGN